MTNIKTLFATAVLATATMSSFAQAPASASSAPAIKTASTPAAKVVTENVVKKRHKEHKEQKSNSKKIADAQAAK